MSKKKKPAKKPTTKKTRKSKVEPGYSPKPIRTLSALETTSPSKEPETPSPVPSPSPTP